MLLSISYLIKSGYPQDYHFKKSSIKAQKIKEANEKAQAGLGCQAGVPTTVSKGSRRIPIGLSNTRSEKKRFFHSWKILNQHCSEIYKYFPKI